MFAGLLERARRRAGLSRAELARRARTSRPTLTAYERGTKSPTLTTAERIIDAAGFEIELVPQVQFHHVGADRGRPLYVPSALPRLPIDQAVGRVVLPLYLNWSDPGREFDLSDRSRRLRAYEIVLREGRPEDILTYIDGALLVDAWPDLVLPQALRRAWEPVLATAA